MPLKETPDRTPQVIDLRPFDLDDIDAVLSLAAVPFSADARERLLEIAIGHGVAVLCRVIKA
ncbi:MAG TPA: hypothetical protein VLH09_10370, partial [Bryobacteraceae bacterium]|nr:hypothetical protein [Bryobacteraceae bacterium]